MDRSYNAKSEKQTIYEIFRACRLCGAGGGYKMPIIQNVVDLDTEIELRQKIKECVQIEVDTEDKMPPLICEICIDKVNDFYEFLEMCQLTNKRTRQRLGLPPQTARGAAEQEDCILGVTEPVFVNHDSEDEPLLGPAKKANGLKKGKKPDPEKILVVQIEKSSQKALLGKEAKPLSRKSRVPSPSPPSSPIRVRDSKTQSRRARIPSPSPPASPIRGRDSKTLSRKSRIPSPSPSASPIRGRDSKTLSRKARIPSPSPPASPIRGRDSKTVSRRGRLPSPSLSPPRGRDNKPSSRKARVPTPSPPSSKPRPASRKVRVPSPSPPPAAKKSTRSIPEEEEKSSQPKTDRSSSKSRKPELTKAQKGILKKEPWPKEKEKEIKPEEPPRPSKKRPAEKERKPSAVPVKKVKITPAAAPKVAPPKPPTPKPPPPVECQVCHVQLKNSISLTNHLRSHHVSFTNPKLACNACAAWFDSPDEAHAHHKGHRAASTPYRCEHCFDTFSGYTAFNEHHEGNACGRYFEFPDVLCAACLRTFPTWTLRDRHRCPGEDGRPGGKCSKCRRSYALLKNLTKHEATCSSKRRGQLIIDPEIMKEIRPAQIVVERCDALLARYKGGYVDVSNVSPKFGLDSRRHYPYFNSCLRVKTDPDGMVNITDELLDYVHWDSDYTSDGDTTSQDSAKPRQVESLTTLTLKVIYSNKFLGKLPKRRRKKIKVETVKTEADVFDSILNGEESFSKDIDTIISTLDADWDEDSDVGDRSILSGIMGISLPDLTSSVRLEDDGVGKIGEEKDSRIAENDVARELDELFGVEKKPEEKSEKNKDGTDKLDTVKVEDKVSEHTKEETDSTNSVKDSKVDNVTKDNKEITEEMDVDGESVKPDVDSKDSIEETSTISIETNQDETKEKEQCKEVTNAENGDVSRDDAKSPDNSLEGDLQESVSNQKDLPKVVSDPIDAAKDISNLQETEISNNDSHNDVIKQNNKDKVCDSAENVHKTNNDIKDRSSEENMLQDSKDTDNLTNRKEEATEEAPQINYVESQTFTENFDDYFKNDRVKSGEGKNENTESQKPDQTDNEVDKSINNDVESKIEENHQKTIAKDVPTRSEPKSDDFSIENILKPSEQVNSKSVSSYIENKTTVTSNGEDRINTSSKEMEIEDKQLMDDLDAHIGEIEDQVNGKSDSVKQVSPQKTNVKNTAMDLDNVSDEEFNFDS